MITVQTHEAADYFISVNWVHLIWVSILSTDALRRLNKMSESQAKYDEVCQSESNKPSNVPKEPTKIIALNEDSLEKIFNRLDLQSLFNVAIANEWLRPVAGKIYNQKFRARTVHVKPSKSNGILPLTEFEDTIAVNGLKSCLLFLRCFGKFITHLKVGYRLNNDVAYDHVNHYITTYCAKYLLQIEFDRTPSSFKELFCKPFANVEFAAICYGGLEQEFSSFPEWFPNIRHLKLNQLELEQQYSGVHFKHLDRLDVNLGFDYSELSEASAFSLLNANQQLRNLIISVDVQHCNEIMVTLLDIIKNNKLISTLTMRTGRNNPLVKRFQIQRIVNEHRNLTELDLDCCTFTANDAVWFIHRLYSLQKFIFCIYDPSEYQKFESKLGKNGKWMCSFDRSSETVTLIRQS